MTNNHRQIVQPGRMNVDVKHISTPAFTPGQLIGQTPTGIQALTFGGATRLEVLAGQLLTGAAIHGPITDEMLQRALEAAGKILAAVEKRSATTDS